MVYGLRKPRSIRAWRADHCFWFDGGDPQPGQFPQPLLHGREAAKKADVQLVQHRFMPGATVPLGMPPAVGAGVHHPTGTLDAARLRARRRIGDAHGIVDPVAIGRAGRAGEHCAVPAAGVPRQRLTLAILEFHVHLPGIGRPQGEAGQAVAQHLGAVRERRAHRSALSGALSSRR